MRKATFIKPEDLQQLEFDLNGNILIPEGFEIFIKQDPEELRLNRIAELEAELQKLTEPTDEELIQEGKMMHPFFRCKDDIKMLKEVQ